MIALTCEASDSRPKPGVRVLVISVAAGILFGSVTAALALAAAWAIANLVGLPDRIIGSLTAIAGLVGLAIGVLVAIRACHAEIRLAASVENTADGDI